MAAVPLVAAILMCAARNGHNVNGFIIHKERKRYGRMNAIEGDISDAPILLVDDVFNSGASLEQSRVVLAENNRTIWKVWSVIDYRSRTGADWQKRHGLTVESVYALEDFGLKLSSPKSQTTQLSFVTRWVNKAGPANHHYVVPKSAPRVYNGLIYVGADTGEMRCVDGANGKTRWSFNIVGGQSKGIWSTPCVTPERVFFGGYDGNLYALCAQSGQEIWRYVEPDWIGSSPAYAATLNLVFIGVEYASPTRGGGIAAIDARSGRKAWECPVRSYVHGSPLYVEDAALVLCGTNDGALLALDARSGMVKWQFQTNGAIKHAPALDLARRQVVLGSFDGGIRGVDLDTGELRFCVQTGNAVYTVPLIDGDRAYCGSTDKYLYVIDLTTGSALARIGAHSKIFASPARIGPWVWFGSTNGRVRAIDPATFALAGVFQLPDAITSAVEYDAVNQMLVVASTGNRLYGVSVTPPLVREGVQRRIDVTALELAKITVDAVANHAPLPDPERFQVVGARPQGGAFVSLRNRATLQRIGRGGQWTFDAGATSPEAAVVVAATKACANLTAELLRDTMVSVSLFGQLEHSTLGQLDHERLGIVVRAAAGGKLGGALPNSPEYSNERGQYVHALRNAKLSPSEGHAIYRHTVERQSESDSWPMYGAPMSFDEDDVTRFATWLLDPQDEPQDCLKGLTDGLSAIAVTKAGTTTLLPMTGATLPDLKKSMRSCRTGAELILVSLIFKGRNAGDRARWRGHFRMDRDALICRDSGDARVFLPIFNMQRGMDEEAFIGCLPDTVGTTWEIAPCRTWAVTEAGWRAIRGAFIEQSHGYDTNIRAWLHDTARGVVHRLDRLTAAESTYLPVDDRYVAADDRLAGYVELLIALERTSISLGEPAWKHIAQSRMADIVQTIAVDVERWHEWRTAIALLVLRDLSDDQQIAALRGCLNDFRGWVQAQPPRPDAGLDLLLAIRLSLHAAKPDLRRFISITKVELSKVQTFEVQDVDCLGQAAVRMIGAGHRELVQPLVEAAVSLSRSQHADTHVFAHACRWGGTADTARAMSMISSAWSVLDNAARDRAVLLDAWRNGWKVIERLRIEPVNACFLQNPAHALNVVRDDEAGARASAAASAATLEILTQQLSSVAS